MNWKRYDPVHLKRSRAALNGLVSFNVNVSQPFEVHIRQVRIQRAEKTIMRERMGVRQMNYRLVIQLSSPNLWKTAETMCA